MNPYRYDIQTLERKARAVRRHIVRLNANSPAGGHTGADLSQVELLTALYFRVLNVAPDRLDDPQRDIYIQSKGHAVAATTASGGSRLLPGQWLETYQHANSHLPGHPVRQKTPGIELNTGALGLVCLLRWGWRWPRRKATAPAAFFDHRRRRTGGRQ